MNLFTVLAGITLTMILIMGGVAIIEKHSTRGIERPPPLAEYIKNCPSSVMDDNCYILMIIYIQRLNDYIDKCEGTEQIVPKSHRDNRTRKSEEQ